MRLMIAGTSSDVGKTTIVLGLMRALKNKGLKVQGYKSGPDYIDTAFHTFATGVPSRNIDTWMFSEETIHELIGKHEGNHDISIMEGVMGMYDGADVKSIEGSSAHVSKLTQTPLILVINGAGVALSAAAMVLGYKQLDPQVQLAGVIVNKVGSKGHYELIKEAIEYHVGVPCLGYMLKSDEISLKSRHLGLIPSVEVEALDQKINTVADMLMESIDFETLFEIARSAKNYFSRPKKQVKKTLKVGLAYDKSFNFYYQDNLDYLEELGCELIKFSPLNDEQLPNDLDGLYIGGGFPEVFAETLQNNVSFKKDLKKKIESGIPTYAECGGLMYLTNSITTLDEKTFEMVGIYDCHSIMTKSLQRFGYVEVDMASRVVGHEKKVRGHEFHRSKVIEDENLNKQYLVHKSNRNIEWECGYERYNCLGAYAHIHFYSNKEVAKSFVESCLRYKGEKNEK